MRGNHALILLLLAAISINIKAQPAPEVGKRWIVVPELTDEFEGTTLNTEKWTTNHNTHPVLIWPGRQPAVFHPDKVKVDSGKVLIEVGKLESPMRVYKYGRYITYEYYGGCLRGFTPTRVGQYYECEAKMNLTEMGGGFWMAAPHSCGKVREIDITESVGLITSQTASWAKDWDHIFHSNGFYTLPDCSETNQTSNKINLPTKNHEEFYRYGFWWKSAGELLFYLNGEYAYSIKLPDDSGRELYLQYDIEAYDWNPFPEDGGRVANGSLEERTTQLNYIHTLKLVDAENPGNPDSEAFNIYQEELTLDKSLTVKTSERKLEIPLSYKSNEDREIHLKLFNSQDELVGENIIPAYAGYANLAWDFNLDSLPKAGTGYTLYADIRPLNSPIADTLMSDMYSLELRDASTVTIQVMDEETNHPLQDVRISLNDSIKQSDAQGLAVFYNISTEDYVLELSKDGYNPITEEGLQIINDTLIIKHLSLELFSLFYSFIDLSSSARIENAKVFVNDSSQITESSGRVHFNVQKGRYKLMLEHPNYLFTDSITVSQNQVEVFSLKKTFSDFYVLVKIDNKAYPNIRVTMGDTILATDSNGRITFPLLKVDSTYHYRVVKDAEILKEDSVKISEYGTLSINISTLTSRSESADTRTMVYPNPTQEILFVSGTKKDDEYKVYDIYGRTVLSGKMSNHSILVKGLPSGAYFLGIEEKARSPFLVK